MAFDRTTVIAGPAIVTHDSYTYYTEGDITVESTRETWAPKTSIYGELSKRAATGPTTKISFTPVGALDDPDNYITYYTPASVGVQLFGLTDLPVAIKSLDNKISTWRAGRITKLPTLRLSPLKTLWGPMEIMCIGARNEDLNSESGQNTFGSGAFTDTSFDPEIVTSAPYVGALGSLPTPFDAIVTEDGFEVEQAITTQPIKIANYGTVNWIISEFVASVKFIPANFDVDDLNELFQLQGSTAIFPGQEVANQAYDLVITGGTTPTALTVTLSQVGPDKQTTRYGLAQLRAGECELFLKKTFTAGALNALIDIQIA